ncbi:MAG: aminotransferase class V-fold PLP-dependent enzyme [Chlamydiales bacterium]|nr:aminotransferase class V-fold PLP-dependent enzyme [Chlamydiales bacterium]
MLYFDHQLKSVISNNVRDTYLRYMNVYSMDAPYQQDSSLIAAYNRSHEEIHEMLGLGPDATFILTSSSSEGIAHVLQSVFIDYISSLGKNQILTTTIEDADTILSLEKYESLEVNTVQIPLNSQGILTVELLKMYVTPKSCLLSLSLANRLTGVIQPIREIAEYCKQQHILLHVDITTCIGSYMIALKEIGADFITFEGSRIGSTIGSGGLIIQHYHKITPLIPSPIEGCFRGGPLHIAGFFAMHAALKEKYQQQDEVSIEVASLRNYFEKAIVEKLGAKTFHKPLSRVCHISCFGLPHMHGQLLAFLLSQQEIFVSFGGGQTQRLEHILESTGIGSIAAKTAVSVCFTAEHTKEDVDLLIDALVAISKKYQLFSDEIYQELVHDNSF